MAAVCSLVIIREIKNREDEFAPALGVSFL